ncbi:MAG TPA: glycosyltransferase family 39 protein, partial [Pyrinomonadaceae bacterium]|nr:glycosyltransferase family 39 protein [Pyrinomonadaceae bacterium]
MSLWALFLLGRRVVGTREALLACALMTFSYHHIWFSQNARGYMALLFFSLLATWLWLEALNRQSWQWWIAYTVAVTGGMLSHLTMAFVVAAHVAVYLAMLLFERRSSAKGIATPFNWRPFVAWGLCVSLTAQLYALALPEFLRVGLHEVSLESEWTSPWWVLAETLRNLRIGFSGLLVVACGGAMFFSGWLNMLRREWQTGALLVLPVLLAGGSMLASGHNLWPRFFFFSMGFALLIAVHGAMVVPQLVLNLTKSESEAFGSAAGITIASLMILASAVTIPRNYEHPKQDYTGARNYVESHRRPGDAVVAVGLAGVAYGRYFAPSWSVAQTNQELDAARRGSRNVWLVYTLPVEIKAYRPDIWEVIQNEFEVVKVFPGTLGGGEVYVCQQPTAKESANESSRHSPGYAETRIVW